MWTWGSPLLNKFKKTHFMWSRDGSGSLGGSFDKIYALYIAVQKMRSGRKGQNKNVSKYNLKQGSISTDFLELGLNQQEYPSSLIWGE